MPADSDQYRLPIWLSRLVLIGPLVVAAIALRVLHVQSAAVRWTVIAIVAGVTLLVMTVLQRSHRKGK